MPDDKAKTDGGGRAWFILLLAMLPFAAKAISVTWLASHYLTQGLYKIFQLGVPVAWRRKMLGRRGLSAIWPIEEGWPSMATWGLAVGIACLLIGTAIVAITSLAPALGVVPSALRKDFDARFALTPLVAIGIVVYLFTINAALEELHFRGWLDRALTKTCGDACGIATSAATFGAMHLFIFAGMRGVGLVQLGLVWLSLTIAGASWSWLARRPGGIQAAWLSHGLTDAGLLTWGLHWLGYF